MLDSWWYTVCYRDVVGSHSPGLSHTLERDQAETKEDKTGLKTSKELRQEKRRMKTDMEHSKYTSCKNILGLSRHRGIPK